MASTDLQQPENVREDHVINVSNSEDLTSQRVDNVRLIIEREYMTRVRQRSFKITTALLMLLVVIGASIPTVFAVLNAKTQTHLTIVNSAGEIAGLSDQGLLNAFDRSLNAASATSGNGTSHKIPPFALKMGALEDVAKLRQQVRDNKITTLLLVSRTASSDLSFEYYTNAAIAQNVDVAQVQALAAQLNTQDKLAKLAVPQSQLATVFAQPLFSARMTQQEQSGRTPAESSAITVVAMLAIVILFMFIQQYSVMVAAGVAEEKGSRIMEILINATTPFRLLLGKIIGIGLVGITQMGLVSIVGVCAFLAQNPIKTALLGDSSSNFNLDITSVSVGLLGLLTLYFVLGFLLYASLYAAAGALVSRAEEVNSSVAPLTFLVMASYLASFYATITPNADWIVPLSYIPFFTPMMILARESVSVLPWWEILLSTLLMVVSIFLCTWIAARVYRVGILMYGQKPGFGSYLKYMRSQRQNVASS